MFGVVFDILAGCIGNGVPGRPASPIATMSRLQQRGKPLRRKYECVRYGAGH